MKIGIMKNGAFVSATTEGTGTIALDETLTVAGQAADAAAVGTALDKVKKEKRTPEKILLYYGSPVTASGTRGVDASVDYLAQYDLVIFGDHYGEQTNSDYSTTRQIITKLKAKTPTVKIAGYVPLGVGESRTWSNFTIQELEDKIDEWALLPIDGMFLDEYGYDYGVTRERQNTILDYLHDKGLFAIPNSWYPSYIFSKNAVVMGWNANPEYLEPHITADDYIIFENLFFRSSDASTPHIQIVERMMRAYEYANTPQEQYDGKTWREYFKCKAFNLEAIPSNATQEIKDNIAIVSMVLAQIFNLEGTALSDEIWGASGKRPPSWNYPTSINFAEDIYTHPVYSYNGDGDFIIRWVAKINGHNVAVEYNRESASSTAYSIDGQWVEIDGEKFTNPRELSNEDLAESIDEISQQLSGPQLKIEEVDW